MYKIINPIIFSKCEKCLIFYIFLSLANKINQYSYDRVVQNLPQDEIFNQKKFLNEKIIFYYSSSYYHI